MFIIYILAAIGSVESHGRCRMLRRVQPSVEVWGGCVGSEGMTGTMGNSGHCTTCTYTPSRVDNESQIRQS